MATPPANPHKCLGGGGGWQVGESGSHPGGGGSACAVAGATIINAAASTAAVFTLIWRMARMARTDIRSGSTPRRELQSKVAS